MSQNRGISASTLEKLEKLKSSTEQRFSYNEPSVNVNNKNKKGIKALWQSQDENAPVESQLMDAKLMNSQLEVSSCLKSVLSSFVIFSHRHLI
jgi:hypothetical protein